MTAARPVADDRNAAVAAGFLGWTLDAFDFFLVVMTLTAIGKEFGKSDAAIALSLTLTLLFRPVGAFIFGLVADRYGRRLPLMIDLVFYSVIEVLTGLAPSYLTFLVLRALFGIGMGAEWGVGASDVWRETRHDSWSGLGRAIVSNWKLFVYLTILMAMMNMVSHGTQDMYPTFLERDRHFGPTGRAALTAFSQVGALVGGVLCGLYSDRLGRRRTIGLALAGAVVSIPIWAFAPTLPLLWTGAFIMQFFVQGAWGVIPAHLNELSPDAVRGFLPGFAYQCGVAIASQIPHVQALFATGTSYAQVMALSAATVFILGAVAAGLGPERRGVAFGRGAP